MKNPLARLIDYKLTDRSLQVVGLDGRYVLREIPYAEMVAVKVGYEWWNEHWENRLDLWRSSVSICLKRPVLPWFVITPEDPAAFAAELGKRMAG